jgi:hypothetical protein
MPSYADCLAALPAFRNNLFRRQQLEDRPLVATAFAAHGAFSAFATPSSNVHATGVGIRQRGGEYILDEHVLKLFVFDKLEHDAIGAPPVESWKGLPVDVEYLPVQVVRARTRKSRDASSAITKAATTQRTTNVSEEKNPAATATAPAPAATFPQRERFRPIRGGISISSAGA